MGMDVGGKGGGVKSDINVTPLVDIVLVLLIIFIVITPAVNNAVKLPLSKYSEKPVTDQGVKYLTLMMPSKRDAKTGQVIGAKPVLIDDPQKKPEEQAGFKIIEEAPPGLFIFSLVLYHETLGSVKEEVVYEYGAVVREQGCVPRETAVEGVRLGFNEGKVGKYP